MRNCLNTLIAFSGYYKIKQVKLVKYLYLAVRKCYGNQSVSIFLRSLMQERHI